MKICKSCGCAGEPKRMTGGSILVELALWCAFLVPGLLYSLWRLTTRYDGCPKCGSPDVIPIDSPVGQKLLAENGGIQATEENDPNSWL